MKFIKSNSKVWQEKKGYSKKIFLDGNDLQFPGALVQKIKIKPGEKVDKHYHKRQTEIFYFLNANGYFIIKNEKITPQIGDVLVIEPFDKHSTINNTNQDFLFMVFKLNYNVNDIYWL